MNFLYIITIIIITVIVTVVGTFLVTSSSLFLPSEEQINVKQKGKYFVRYFLCFIILTAFSKTIFI